MEETGERIPFFFFFLMVVLGVDTATAVTSVGLVRDGELVAAASCQTASSQAETLLPLIKTLLSQSETPLTAVSGIGISIGPGSFSGLRIGLGTMKGFAYALGCKVVGIPTLEALAHTVTSWEGTICPLLDARKGEVYTALFLRWQNGDLQRLSPDLVLAPEELCYHITTPCLFLGEGVERYREFIRKQCGSAASILSIAPEPTRGETVAKLACERLCRGEYDDLYTLEPTYVRRPEAELKGAERRATSECMK